MLLERLLLQSHNLQLTTAHNEPWFFLAIHIIVPIFLTGRKNDIFLIFLFIKMSFFHYNIAKAFFAIKFVRHRIWKEWKYSMDKDFEAFIYCDKGIYKSIKIFGWNSEHRSMLHPKGTWRIFDKEKSNNFPKDFANGKIDTIMGLATLYLHMWKECIKNGGSKPPPYVV